MSDKAWKQLERRLARQMGTQRIPVTGERHGVDAQTELFAFQFKLRRRLPKYLWAWVRSIVGHGDRIGVVVIKALHQRDEDALVVLRWKDWVDLHGEPKG